MSGKEFFDEVKKEILQHPCFSDPFVCTISSLRSFPLEQARRFGLLYYPHILRTRLYQANALGITPDENIQFVFAQILHDEYGNGDAQRSHMAVYRKFLIALGISNADLQSVQIIPELALYIDSMMRLTQSENWLAAVGAVGIASEWPIPFMYNKMLAGLRLIPSIKEDDLELFSGHVELDIEHAGMMEQAIIPHLDSVENQKNLLLGIYANLNARRIFMQGLYREVLAWKFNRLTTRVNSMRTTVFLILLAFLSPFSVSAHEEKTDNTWWWDSQWWDKGWIKAPVNHNIRVDWISYDSNGVDVPAMVARPDDNKKYPAVLFQHGRRGLDELVQRLAKRVAARGFVVLAPDIYKAHFIGTHPIEHDYELEKDVNKGLDVLLGRTDISTSKACVYSHTRGGYYTLKVAVSFNRQAKDIACYVSYYPHLQDPNAPEPSQVYGYAPEIDKLKLPVLVFIGEQEQYQRRRVIETSIKVLESHGQNARLIVYPGVGRGFDFRPENVRTFADDLASKDAVQRAVEFMQRHLKP